MKRRRSSRGFALAIVVLPGCALVGSPVSALEGAGPYGWTAFDVGTIRGTTATPHFVTFPGWLGAVDLPFAFVMDTALLPVSIPVAALHASGGVSGRPWDEALFAELDLDEHPRVVAEVGRVTSWRTTGEVQGGWPRRQVLRVFGPRGECRVTVYVLDRPLSSLGAVPHDDGVASAVLETGVGDVDLFAGRGVPASDRR